MIEDLAFGLFHQSAQEAQKDRCREAFLEHHEIEMAPIRERRKHVAAETLPRAGNRWRLSSWRIRAPRLMVRAHTHLIAPVYQGLFLLGRLANRRVFLF